MKAKLQLVVVALYLSISLPLAADTFTNTKGVALEGSIVTADLKAGTVTLFIRKYRKEFPLKLTDLDANSQAKVKAWWDEKHPKPADWVKPGATQTLDFPELGKMNHNDETAACEVYIPSNYDPAKPVPLIVWLTGGKGGNRVGGAKNLAGTEDFLCVALPYPPYEGRDIFARREDDGAVPFWNYQKTMLDAVAKAVPNIDKRMRVISGFSNGAHSIANYFDQVQEELAATFNVFIFGDGGASQYYDGSWKKKNFRGGYAYCTWGETSENSEMTQFTADLAEKAGLEVTRSEMANTGHKFIPEEKEKVKTWLLEVVKPALLSSQP